MSIGATSPFRPTGTVSLNATTSSNAVALPGGGESVVVTNATSALVFVRFGADPSVTATNSDMPILANGKIMLSVNNLIGYAAAITGSGGGMVYFTRGDGSYI
jgi:hypothetical protein